MEVREALHALRQHRQRVAASRPTATPILSHIVTIDSTKSRSTSANTLSGLGGVRFKDDHSTLRDSFHMLKLGTVGAVIADAHVRQRMLFSFFRRWRKCAVILRRIKAGTQVQRLRVSHRCFKRWREMAQFASHFRHLRKRVLERKAYVRRSKAFHNWQQFLLRKRKSRCMMDMAIQAHYRSRAILALALLSRNKRRRMKRRELEAKAKACYRTKHLKPCWLGWQEYVSAQRQKHVVEAEAMAAYQLQCIRRGLGRLTANSLASQKKRASEGEFRRVRRNREMRKWIACWKINWEDQRRIERANGFALTQAWKCLVKASKASFSQRCEDAARIWRRELKRKCFVALACSAARESHTRRVLDRLVKKYTQKIVLLRLCMYLDERRRLAIKVEAFVVQRKKSMLAGYYQGLLNYTTLRKTYKSRLELATSTFADKRKTLAIQQLKNQVDLCRIRRKQRTIAAFHYRRACLKTFARGCTLHRRSRKKVEVGEHAYIDRSKHRSLLALHAYALRRRESRMSACNSRWHYASRVRRKQFKAWRLFAIRERRERTAVMFHSGRMIRFAFVHWKRGVDLISFERKRMLLGEKHYVITQSRSAIQRKATRAAVRLSKSQAKRRTLTKLRRFKRLHKRLCSQVAVAEAFVTCRRRKAGLGGLLQFCWSKRSKRVRLAEGKEQLAFERKRRWFRRYRVITLAKKQLRVHERRLQQACLVQWNEFQDSAANERVAATDWRRRATRVAFVRLRQSRLDRLGLRCLENEVRSVWRSGVIRRMLVDWRESWLHFVAQSNFLAAAEGYRNRRMLDTFFRAWKAEYVTNRLELEFYRVRLVGLMQHCFEAWRGQVLASLVEETNEAVAELHWRKDLLRKSFGFWQLGTAAIKREEAADAYVVTLRIKRCFEAWKAGAAESKVRSVESVVADIFWRKKALEKCFHLLALSRVGNETHTDATFDLSFFQE